MLKMFYFGCFFAISTVVLADQIQPTLAKTTSMSLAEAAIRSARNELNASLVNRDIKTTTKYWLPDISTIGGDGGVWVGYDKNIEGFSDIFKDPNFVTGLRTPEKIEIATGGPKSAAETGVWEWRERVRGQVLTFSGRYLVMWSLADEKWRIRSELYVTTGCTGGTNCQ